MTAFKSPTIAGVAAAGLLLATAGCATDEFGRTTIDKRAAGTAVGAVAGGAIGSTIGAGSGNTVAIVAGSLIGALIGGEYGRLLDEQDRQLASRAAQDALERYPSGSNATWTNPDTGASGVVSPQPPFRDDRGQICREYTQTVTIDGRGETVRGVACRNPDGTWRIVNA